LRRQVGRRSQNRALAGLFLLSFLILFASGCDKYTRYKVSSFFFTGVPPLEEANRVDTARTQAGGKERKRIRIKKVVKYIHGPKASGECYHCHEASGRKRKKVGIGAPPSLQATMPGKLTESLKKLCIKCHASKSAEAAQIKNLWLHRSTTEGNCTLCHNPHESPFRYMLITEKSTDLCTQCHLKEYLQRIEEHTENRVCISCHNPHIGKNRFLLKKDFNEVF